MKDKMPSRQDTVKIHEDVALLEEANQNKNGNFSRQERWDNFALESTKRMRESVAIQFITENFKSKRCVKFIPDKKNSTFCCCGAERDVHPASAVADMDAPDSSSTARRSSIPRPPKLKMAAVDERDWNRSTAIEERSTNAFGRIEFHPIDRLYRKPAKYIRLADNSNMDLVLELMKSYWHLCDPVDPGIVISVIGSTRLTTIVDRRKREAFNRGIIRSIKTTRGWLLTLGTNSGVSQLIGSAVQEGQTLEWRGVNRMTRAIHCIGIAPWGGISDREELINTDSTAYHNAKYFVKPTHPSKWMYSKQLNLNPYHSHFLLVDDGFRRHKNKRQNVSAFRARLERKLAAPKTDGGLGVPVVGLLVEGGLNSIEAVLQSCVNNTPVLVCQGTGKAADLIAETIGVYNRLRENKTDSDDSFGAKLRKLIAKYIPYLGPDLTQPCVDKLTAICKNQKFISVFTFERADDFDMAILSCLLEAKKLDFREQLTLALNWDRADIAAERILSNPDFVLQMRKNKNGVRNFVTQCLNRALVEDKTEFVKILVDSGVSVGKFLTVATLRQLYRDTVPYSEHLARLFDRRPTELQAMTLSSVYVVIKRFTRRYTDKVYQNDSIVSYGTHAFDYPSHELFLWAVLLNRQQLALYFWELCKEPITTGVVGTLLCRGMKHKLGKSDHSNDVEISILDFKVQLESAVIGVVNTAYNEDRQKATMLVNRPSATWGNLTPIGLAAIAADKHLLATKCCQHSIFQTWKRGFQASGFAITCTTFTLFPIYWSSIIDFDIDHENEGPPLLSRDTPSYTTQSPYLTNFNVRRHSERAPKLRDLRPQTSNALPASAPVKSYPFFLKRKGQLGRDTRSESITSEEDLGVRCVKRTGWLDKLLKFYSAPVAKFVNHTLWYVLFLILYSYVVLYNLQEEPVHYWPELLLYCWIFTFLLEEVRFMLSYPGETLLDKMGDWWSFGSFATWNRIDVTVYLLSIVAFGLRWEQSLYPLARLLLVLALVGYILRIFKIYFVNSYLGPKVVMLKRMSKDLFMFVLVLIVFFFAYSISTQALIRAGKGFESESFWEIFQGGIWNILGEPSENHMEGKIEVCEKRASNASFYLASTNGQNGTDGDGGTVWDWECILRTKPIPFLLTLYLLFGNVLMINMLIAIFTHVFDEVQANSEVIWKYEMFYLVEEYKEKPLLPPPFILISHMYYILNWTWRACRKCRSKPKQPVIKICGKRVSPEELEYLSIFENVSRYGYLDNLKISDSNKMESVVGQLQENILKLQEQVSDLADRNNGLMSQTAMIHAMTDSTEDGESLFHQQQQQQQPAQLPPLVKQVDSEGNYVLNTAEDSVIDPNLFFIDE